MSAMETEPGRTVCARNPEAGGAVLKVFLDDERATPEGWTAVRWPEEAIALLKTGKVDAISLDHDLGDEITGVHGACGPGP